MGYRFDADLMFLTYKDLIGYDPVAAMVNYQCDIQVEGNELPKPQQHAFKKCGNGFMLWSKKAACISKIYGVEELRKIIPDAYIDIWRKPGDKVDEFRSMAAIAFCCEDCEELCHSIEAINETLHIYDEYGEDIIIKYTDFDYLKKVYYEGLDGK